MKLLSSLCTAALILGMAAQLTAQKPEIQHTNLKVGDKAPDFTLKGTDWKDVKLSDYRGKKTVVLAFYVLAFTGG